ncbi:NADPH cytochrome P450 [Penicillium cf. griseofulvum]|uniref:Bifunctional cytochrome P450/NADPH--P450 reductase n=1 Tax=Penicillium cf. griseofulvum TaxID=2972120 RepID=A0A9W9M0R2_9EURO|nr:NADPH cytochrome P450 [Penicillium cf. griseofulvum]KAJ5430275.1 NADPH cytochrome P450 [Penicillium cf. griseofulvum]KAJ5435955.1 NADPH cytochrome P450 [Penicillium cf. griseofulvum]
MTEIPQPPGLPYIGSLFEIDPKFTVKSLRRLGDIHGPIYDLRIVNISRIVVCNHELFDELCDENRFVKSVSGPLSQMRNLVHDSLFTAHPNEQNWGIAHRILAPAFGPVPIQEMFHGIYPINTLFQIEIVSLTKDAGIYDIASQLVLKWARHGSSKPINVQDDCTRFTLDAVTLCAMGVRLNSLYSEEKHPFVQAMDGFMRESNYRAQRPAFLTSLLWWSRKQYDRDISFIRKFAKDLIDIRRSNPTEDQDILNALIKGRDPKTGQQMSEESIIDNMVTFLIAGHETTSGGISFLLYHIVKNQEVWKKVQKEVNDVVGSGRITSKHLSKLRYITTCVRESLRLWPTIPVIAFKPTEKQFPTIIGQDKFAIMPRQTVIALLPAIHRDPDVWGDDAEEFRPERMTDENLSTLPRNAWKAFGNGARGCIGRPFAMTEMVLITALLAQNFDVDQYDPSYELDVDQIVTLRLRDFFLRAKLKPGLDSVQLANRLFNDQEPRKGPDAEAAVTPAVKDSLKPITVLYGSNTGTCESLALNFTHNASRYGFDATMLPLDSALEKLPTDRPVIILTASYEGQPAGNAVKFVSWLEKIKEPILSGVSFAVFGCGNSDWAATFHRIPKLIDRLLSEAGAKRLLDLGLVDVSSMSVQETFEDWSNNKLWPALRAKYDITELRPLPSELRVEFANHLRQTFKENEFIEASVIENRLLTAPGVKAKRHLELALPPNAEYKVGDYLHVLPVNPQVTVQRAMRYFHLAEGTYMKVTGGLSTALPTGTEIYVEEVLSRYVELCQPATQRNMERIAQSTPDLTEQESLRQITASGTSIQDKRLGVLDLLEHATSSTMSFADFLSMLTPLRARTYSISSSPLKNARSCSLSVSIVDNIEPNVAATRVLGISTHYISHLKPDQRILCSIRPSNPGFNFPDSPENTPMVMVCVGSGIAPFRGFLQERSCRAKQGQKLAPAFLFFGCKSPTDDRIYGSELDQLEEAGIVTVRYAYSGLPGREHVQDKLWDERETLIGMYKQGARFYLCGPVALRNSVLTVVKKIYMAAAEANGKDEGDEYEDWLGEMNRGRFAVDTFA